MTPKGTRPGQAPSSTPAGGSPSAGSIAQGSREVRHAAAASSRYTPPVPTYMKESPKWVPILMFALWILGALIIILYYLGWVPGGRSQWYLLVGLASILGGLWTATKYH